MRTLLAAALALAACPACSERRQPIHVQGDAGPSVVVVDPVRKRPVLGQLPLTDEVEPDDDLEHAQPLEPGKGVRGTIGVPSMATALVKGKPKGDVDVYSWLEPGPPADGGFDEARVELNGVPGLDLVLEVLAGDGSRLWLANDGGAGEPEIVPNVAFEPGHTYYLRVRAATADKSDPAHPYELTLRSQRAITGAEREPDDDAAHATPALAPTDVNGYWGRRRDEDWLRLPALSQAGILRLELGPVESVLPEIKVTAGGALLASSRGGRGDELRLRNVGLPANQDVLVQLRAVDGRNPLDRWTLKLGLEPPLDGAEREPNDTIVTAQPLALEGAQPVAGFLWPGDQDVYKIGGPPDELFTAEVEGLERVDLKIDRLGEGGKLLARADDAGVGMAERLAPWPVGAAAYVRVSARARDTAFDAPYRLIIAPLPPDPELEREPNDTPASATTWASGAASMKGYLAPRGDEDLYRFVAPAGKTRATVVVEPPPGLSLTVKLIDESRAPLGPSEGAARASGPVASGKSYFVSVKGGEKTSNPRDTYKVMLTLE